MYRKDKDDGDKGEDAVEDENVDEGNGSYVESTYNPLWIRNIVYVSYLND